MNADVNGAVNIRRKITQNPPTEDMSNGRLARPVAYLFNKPPGRSTRGSKWAANRNIPTLGNPRPSGREDVNLLGGTDYIDPWKTCTVVSGYCPVPASGS